MPPRRKPARPSILVAPGVSRARTSLPGPRARAFTALALLSTALLLLLHFAASRGSPLSSARSRGSPLSDSDSAKNKTESREGICEHLQSTAPHNATGNEALITEVPIFGCICFSPLLMSETPPQMTLKGDGSIKRGCLLKDSVWCGVLMIVPAVDVWMNCSSG
ncbi:hypothetical protein BDA96_01G475700 [Sorghum bicolor]|uniref:Uncharacterized protein n=1 Tax=Sorghum bicolor TaxID=4558 RepID=A0A921V3N2_SORBI|nr:hypothetical protein BDA96_01G475700 [Sorghum bicolor]